MLLVVEDTCVVSLILYYLSVVNVDGITRNLFDLTSRVLLIFHLTLKPFLPTSISMRFQALGSPTPGGFWISRSICTYYTPPMICQEILLALPSRMSALNKGTLGLGRAF